MGGEPDTAGEHTVETLRALVRLPTVSRTDPARIDPAPFAALADALAEAFPLLHRQLTRHTVAEHALLFCWPGRTPGSAAQPLVLMAHQDVVPVDESAPWRHPPYGAEVHDGAIWGRGTLDDKGALVAVCAAVEGLLADGFTPARDVWLSFGAREEVSGTDAADAVAFLREAGVRPWLVLDEGGAVAADAFPGIDPPLAVVGVAEKGTTTLRIRAEGRGGHSSTPAPHGPTARIARAVVRLEKRPVPGRLPEPTVEMFRRLAPHAPRALRPLLASAGPLAPALVKALQLAGPEPAAQTRTTMAVTGLEGSPAHNVVASSASAVVNLRLQLGDSVASAVAHVRRAIRDPSLSIEVLEAGEPSPVSRYDDEGFALVAATVEEVFPDAVATPYVMMAATDARHFHAICDRVFRFAPFRMSRAQRESIHSYDEHLRIDDFLDGVRWYRRLIEGLPA